MRDSFAPRHLKMIRDSMRHDLIRATLPFLLALSTTASAQIFTLRAAIRFGLYHNSTARIAQTTQLIAHDRVHAAQAANRPTLSASYSYLFSNDPLVNLTDQLERRAITAQSFSSQALNYPGMTRLGTTDLTLSWPVYSGGAFSDREQAARYADQAARNSAQATRETVIEEIIEAYEGVLAAQTALHIAQKAVTAAAMHAQTTETLYQQGRIIRSDALTASVNLSANQELLAKAQGVVTDALAHLALVMGASPSVSIEVPPHTLPDLSVPPTPIRQLMAIALTHSHAIKALQARIRATQHRAAAAGAASGIQVRLTASTDWYSQTPGLRHNAWSVAGVIQKSLYDGGESRDRADILTAQSLRLQDRLAGLTARIDYAITTAYNNMSFAAQRYRIAKTTVAHAKETVTLIRRRYGEGRTILLEVLNAENSLVNAREARLAALYTLVNNAVRLQAIEGTLSLRTLSPFEGKSP